MEKIIFKIFKSRLIFGKYSIKFLISKSTFSEVYFGTNVLNGKNYALKIGTNEKDNYVLKNESYILINLKGPGIPSVISYGVSGKYNILVENLLGKSIWDIWNEKNKRFNLKDTCIFAIQAISLLEYVHSKNYLHRDIKPANFLVGNPDNSQIYLIDFGNAKKFRSSKTGKHIKIMKSKLIFGALLFLSMNIFKQIESARKDELESLGLVIIYLFLGELPWSNAKFYSIKDEEPYIYYSCNMDAEFIEIPKLSFFNKILNETFVLTFDNLFSKYNARFYFNVVFRKKPQNNWVLGELFLNNYKFVFDTEEERIGYYKTKVQESHPYIALISILFAFVIFLIIYLNGNRFNIGKENIFYNQQLQQNLHPQERKEYANDINKDSNKENKEKNKNKKGNKKEKKE